MRFDKMLQALRRRPLWLSAALQASGPWCSYRPAERLSSSESSPGMFGIDGLHNPQDFTALAKDAMRNSQAMVEQIRGLPPGPPVIDALDSISDTVCQVLDPAELCRNVAASPEWRAAATQTCINMEKYVQTLNMNLALYRAVAATVAAAEEVSSSHGGAYWESAEQGIVAKALHHDFVLGGVQLPDPARGKVAALKNRIHHVGMEFQAALGDPTQLGRLHLSPQEKRACPFSTTLDPGSLSNILHAVRDEDIRRRAYLEGYRTPEANLGRLDEVIRCRNQLARATGFDSYASYSIMPYSLAKNPQTVSQFLTGLAESLRPAALKELEVLQTLKAASSGGARAATHVRAWDKLHLMAQARAKASQGDRSTVTDYFPLEACVKGLGMVTKRTMGLRLVASPIAPGETWAPGVQKFCLTKSDGETVGTMYFDLLQRKNKFQQAAHFNVRSGRQLNSASPKTAPSNHQYQKPVVALVCNFDPARGLALTELETLFHEFGHALHSVLSETKYQHLAGVRGALDCVEVPSHLWQLFASDARVVQAFSSHRTTGEPIPMELFNDIHRGDRMFSALDLQQQVVYSMLDQEYWGQNPPGPGNTTQVLAELHSKYTDMPLEPGVHPQVRFSHLIGYGASYYSYLYARSLASSLWTCFFEEDPLALGSGEVLGKELLACGGALVVEDKLHGLLGSGSFVLPGVNGGWAPNAANIY